MVSDQVKRRGEMKMKIEIGKEFPEYFKPLYPEEFELFSHFEVTAGIPTVLFAVTTWKENGQPNVCFHAWSCFHGRQNSFLCGDGKSVSAYAYLRKYPERKMLLYQFLPISCYDRLVETIHHNNFEEDEFWVGDFTLTEAKEIHAPKIEEAFLSLECTLRSVEDLSGAGITAMVTGQVVHATVDEGICKRV